MTMHKMSTKLRESQANKHTHTQIQQFTVTLTHTHSKETEMKMGRQKLHTANTAWFFMCATLSVCISKFLAIYVCVAKK